MGCEDCEVNYMWSLCSLVGAFLDLAIAYFLLCASSVVFLGTKFLSFFGLHLPCPCNGLFGAPPNRSLCLKKLLVDFPSEKSSNVQLSVKGKFPFNAPNCHVNLRLVGENDNNGLVEIEGEEEASCSVPRIEFKPKNEVGVVKGKGVLNYKSRGWIRRRRKRASSVVDHWTTSSSVSSYDPQFVDLQSGSPSPPSINKEWIEIRPRSEDSKELYANGDEARCSNQHEQPPTGTTFGQRDSFELNEFSNDDEHTEKNVSSYEELKARAEMGRHLGTDDKNAIRFLELALEEERATRAAVYLELEKERNAAATAADEAMAMISRLQEEKASIEMEARQYKRMIEEKSAYDAEEMNILKEIVVRREREKHVLEKEVETYRQMICVGNETERQFFNSSLDENEDPVLMLHQLSASIDKKIMTKSKQNHVFPLGMESSTLEWNEDASFMKQEVHEKEMVTIINGSNVSQAERERLEENIHDEECFNLHGKDVNQEFQCSSNLTFDKELHVHDIHVIDDGSKFCNEGKRSERKPLIDVTEDMPSTSSSGAYMEIKKNGLDQINQIPPLGPKGRPGPPCDVRRHSMSTIDIERLKLDYEVERLRERLKTVQEGREKLNLLVENREGDEKLQLKLLEDIANQLREIRQLREPGKAARQASLPLPLSKVTSKKKRCRSVSIGYRDPE